MTKPLTGQPGPGPAKHPAFQDRTKPPVRVFIPVHFNILTADDRAFFRSRLKKAEAKARVLEEVTAGRFPWWRDAKRDEKL